MASYTITFRYANNGSELVGTCPELGNSTIRQDIDEDDINDIRNMRQLIIEKFRMLLPVKFETGGISMKPN